nr:YeeE/YedE thiosulfate transporter family protein [Clostridium polynesiense]
MKTQKWTLSALILGAVFFIAVWAIKPIGVSTQFSVLSGIIHSAINPNVITEDAERESGYKSVNAYYDKSKGDMAKNIKNPWNYDFVFVLSIPLGAYIGYLVKKKDKKAKSADIRETIKLPEEKENFWRFYLPSFIGGFLLLYGARMADGCTSGHMMSGMMQGAVSGYIFAAAVFAVAIPTAIIRGRILRGGR